MNTIRITLCLLAALCVSNSLFAQESAINLNDDVLKVGIHAFDGCVKVLPNGKVAGFEIELLEAAAKEVGFKYEIVENTTFAKLLESVKAGNIDAGVAGITINAEREAQMDFSVQSLQGGYSYLVKGSYETDFLSTVWAFLTGKGGALYFLYIGFCLVAGFIFWFLERGSDSIADDPRKGIPEGVWGAAATTTTVGYGDIAVKRFITRVFVMAVIMPAGIFLFGMMSGSFTDLLSEQRLDSHIQSVNDLAGKVVCTKEGSSSVSLANELGASQVIEFSEIEEAIAKVENGEADAVVFDDAVLRSYASTEGAGQVAVSQPFKQQSYGFALGQGSKWRDPLNQGLLKVRESGYYDYLYQKYFGTN